MAINVERARARRQNEKAKIEQGISLDQFVPELAEHGIYLEPKQWERKLSATSGALKSSAAIVLGASGVDMESAEMAAKSLGVKSITLGMTEAEGRATSIIDESAIKMLSSEPVIKLEQWYAIANVFHPKSKLSQNEVDLTMSRLTGLDLSKLVISSSPTEEVLTLKVEGQSITLSKNQYLSLLTSDIYERARAGNNLWENNDSNMTPLSIIASAIRNQTNIGLLVQRNDEVLAKIKEKYEGDLNSDILDLIVAQHFGYHGTGEEKFFVKVADGQVVEQTRMTECDGCAHGAEETISNLNPEMPISEMVTEFEARQIEPIEMPEFVQPMYFDPTMLAIPFGMPGRVEIVTSATPQVEGAQKPGSPVTLEPLRPNPLLYPKTNSVQLAKNEKTSERALPSTSATTTLKHSSTIEKRTAKKKPLSTRGVETKVRQLSSDNAVVASQRVFFETPEGLKIVRRASTKRVLGESAPRQLYGQRQVNRATLSDVRQPDNTKPPSRPSILGGGWSQKNIYSKRAPQKITTATGSTLQKAFEQVHAGVVTVMPKVAQVNAVEHSNKNIAKIQVIAVGSQTNAVREDGIPTNQVAASPAGTKIRVVNTVSKSQKKRKLGMGMHLALATPTNELNVTNPHAAKAMIYTALGV